MGELPDDLIIWKYMDLPKFLDLLENEHLYFCKVRILTDLYECSFPELQKRTKAINDIKDLVFVNCWSISNQEDFALWKVYSNNNEYGVAIRTTVGKLKSCLQHSEPYSIPTIRFNKVVYSDNLKDKSLKSVVCTKKPFYSYEKELRLWLSAIEKTDIISNGLTVNLDINKMIEGIYISPFMPEWFHLNFISIVAKYKRKTFLHSKIIPSSIKEKKQ